MNPVNLTKICMVLLPVEELWHLFLINCVNLCSVFILILLCQLMTMDQSYITNL